MSRERNMLTARLLFAFRSSVCFSGGPTSIYSGSSSSSGAEVVLAMEGEKQKVVRERGREQGKERWREIADMTPSR